MSFSIIFLVFILPIINTNTSFYLDPTNETITDTMFSSIISATTIPINLTQYTLPPFSQTKIYVDLRHLQQIPNITVDNQIVPIFKFYILVYDIALSNQTLVQMTDIAIGSNQYTLQVTKQMRLALIFQILNQFQSYSYLLMKSSAVKVFLENIRVPQSQSSFLFIVNKQNDIHLPYNRPNISDFNGYFLGKIQSNRTGARQTITPAANSYWSVKSSFAVPYFPYFSNCRGYGDNIYFSQTTQDQDQCNLIAINETSPISQLKFGSSPIADTCTIQKNCLYDEIGSSRGQFPYWQTLPSGSVLFQMTNTKILHSDYDINIEFKSSQLVNCQLSVSKGTNSSNQFPLQVKVTMGYYQVNQIQKKMISCSIQYSLYVPSTSPASYQLQISLNPLNNTQIMLSFGFDWYVYMIIFIMIGTISSLQNFILWLYHYLVAEQSKPFRLKIYFRVIKQIFIGAVAGLSLFITLLFMITMLMNGKIFDTTLYSSNLPSTTPRVFWDNLSPAQNIFDSIQATNLRSGRMGLSFFVVGCLIIFRHSHLFVCSDRKKQEYDEYEVLGRSLKPADWNQGRFLIGTFFYIFLQMVFIYFAYSNIYSQNIWVFIGLMKVIQIVMEQIAKIVFDDYLPCLPLKVITDITAFMNTLSANDFYQFLLSFLIDVGINMIQKAYVSQIQNLVVEKIQEKVDQISKIYENFMNDTEEEIQQNEQQQLNSEDQNQYVMIYRQADQVNFFEQDQIQQYKEDPFQYQDSVLMTSKSQSDQHQLNQAQIIRLINKKIQGNNSFLFNSQNQSVLRNNSIHKTDDQQKLLKSRLTSYLQQQNKTSNKRSQQETLKNKQQDQITRNSVIFQMLMDVILMLFTFILQPFVVLVFWITYQESSILSNYGITADTVILYLLNAGVIAVFTVFNVILIYHLLESYLNISFQQTISSLLTRFQQRKVFWKATDCDLNMKIDQQLRGADHYCLSSQFFFILTVYLAAMILVLLGTSVMIQVQYNPFRDIASVLITMFWTVLLNILIWLLQNFAKCINVWGYQDFQANKQKIKKPSIISIKDEIFISQKNTQDNNIFGQQDTKSIPQSANQSSHALMQSKFDISNNPSSIQPKLIINKFDKINQVTTAQTKLQTICKKLQVLKFSNDKFRFDYSHRNKTFLKKNIQKILPLVQNLPQLQDYKLSQNKSKNEDSKNLKNENKNLDPTVSQMLIHWFKATEKNRQSRKLSGIDLQKNLKRCNFCYQSWGIYHGYGGICFKCSKKLFEKSKKQ